MQASEAQKSQSQQVHDAMAPPNTPPSDVSTGQVNTPASDVPTGQATRPPFQAAMPSSSPTHPPRRLFGLGWLGMIVVILAGALGGYWFSQRMDRVETSAARRLQGADQRIVQLEAQTRLYQDELRELGSRASVLESKLSESIGQQAQLEQLYKSMAVESADALLHELERSVLSAVQQLQFGGLNTTLLVLGEIDLRLGRLREPSLLAVQRALQRDIERLKAESVHDPIQVAQRLDVMLGQVDALQLLSEARFAPEQSSKDKSDSTGQAGASTVAKATSAGAPKAASSQEAEGIQPWVNTEQMVRWVQQLGSNLLTAIRDLFRVTRVDRPDALLAAPQEAYFLREQLRLHLMSARLAAMWRNDVLFRTDTDRASLLLQRYFDPQQRLVGAQLESLKQLQSMRLSLDQQALAETLTAIRGARSARDARTTR
ncbi:MAG: hypothetical protein EBT36_00095 [Betaproteobacteria bacterium]|jgi:uroporphyrin-III C-methyltransferase|nr:uroporphyrinogen-III C-methyltransferase [Pseudomonadota bacterium]NBO02623.1 hypothetical protein [Betaproteobacteria bacterium]NBO95601.1 hypothetical protein [Betaproteobacteria bacterium]NBP34769.1 hypothetical protein [Betaproteobacteria bacterium]NBP37476.1 hypothetical protein [Betaproteobacteria bacterium]